MVEKNKKLALRGKTTFVSVVTALLSFDSSVCDVLRCDILAMSAAQKVNFRGRHIGFESVQLSVNRFQALGQEI